MQVSVFHFVWADIYAAVMHKDDTKEQSVTSVCTML
jgi:hypothetical protein